MPARLTKKLPVGSYRNPVGHSVRDQPWALGLDQSQQLVSRRTDDAEVEGQAHEGISDGAWLVLPR